MKNKTLRRAVLLCVFFALTLSEHASDFTKLRNKVTHPGTTIVQVVSETGKGVSNLANNTVGVALDAGGHIIKGGGDELARAGHGAGHELQRAANGTMHEVMRLGNGVSGGVSDGYKWAKEHKEAIIVVAAICYGGYLVYSANFNLTLAIGTNGQYAAVWSTGSGWGAGATAVATVGAAGTAAVQTGLLDNKMEDKPSPPTTPKPEGKEAANIPDGSLVPITLPAKYPPPPSFFPPAPQKALTDAEKMKTVYEMKAWYDKLPNSPQAMSETIGARETALIDTLVVINSLAPTYGDKVENEMNNPKISDEFAGKAVEIATEGVGKMSIPLEFITTVFNRTATADGTLAGQGSRESMAQWASQELGRLWAQRVADGSVLDPDEVKQVMERGDQPVVLPGKP